ncbi:hypothetical protein [Streptomyces thermoalcalitolerans]|uniref:Uncharacterized protein n=1 Tax=Streptomyces thermoalcalitolerans TaxID=65605 RepID=A0ABN1PBB5_9ACTN
MVTETESGGGNRAAGGEAQTVRNGQEADKTGTRKTGRTRGNKRENKGKTQDRRQRADEEQARHRQGAGKERKQEAEGREGPGRR